MSAGNSQLFTACSCDKEKNATFLPEHCCCHKSDYHLISPYNVASQSHIIHENKGIDCQLKRLLIVKQVLLSTAQEIYGNFTPGGVVFRSCPQPHLPNFSSIAPF